MKIPFLKGIHSLAEFAKSSQPMRKKFPEWMVALHGNNQGLACKHWKALAGALLECTPIQTIKGPSTVRIRRAETGAIYGFIGIFEEWEDCAVCINRQNPAIEFALERLKDEEDE